MDYHSSRFEDYSLMVLKKEKLIAVLPANRIGNQIHSHQGLSYGGLILSNEITLEDTLMSFKLILKHLNEASIETLNLKLTPKIYHKLPSDEMDYLLFKVKAKLYRRDLTTSILNSNKLKIKSSNRKRSLDKAKKNKLLVKEVNDFNLFWTEILTPNLLQKHGVLPVHNIEEITLLKEKFPNNIKQYNVYKDSEIVAGVTVFETEIVAHAQYISANEKKQKSGSLDILFDYLINHIYKDKCYFDFGISNTKEGELVNKGLMSWKESFGARSITHDFYKVETCNYNLLEDVII